MVIKFFCYEKDTGRLFVALPDLPDNDFENDKRVVFDGMKIADGIKWENADWQACENIEVENDNPANYIYIDGEIVFDPQEDEDED